MDSQKCADLHSALCRALMAGTPQAHLPEWYQAITAARAFRVAPWEFYPSGLTLDDVDIVRHDWITLLGIAIDAERATTRRRD